MQPIPKRRLFVVDAHQISRCGWHFLISDAEDLEICGEAGTASEALEMVEKTRPDLVITGLSFPDHSGLDLVEELRAAHPELFILVLSMHSEEIYGERVFRAGGSGFIMKTASADQLLEAVRQVLRGKHYMSQSLTEFYFSTMVTGTPPKLPLDRLTKREMEIFDLIGGGENNETISKRLGIGSRTVERHRTNMRKKLGLADANELLRFAVCHIDSLGSDGKNPPRPPTITRG